MNKKYKVAVFIGRFQPLHAGHEVVINKGLEIADHVFILVGSSYKARSPKNPFTFEERKQIIENAYRDEINMDRLHILPIEDHPYNDDAWIYQVQTTVYNEVYNADIEFDDPLDRYITLIGYAKDHSSYYLKMFPHWDSIEVTEGYKNLSATDIRNQYWLHPNLRNSAFDVPDPNIRKSTVDFMIQWSHMNTKKYEWLQEEHLKYDEDITKREAGEKEYGYPIPIICADAVVYQSGHVLLVTRGKHPGKGLLALPGGHVEPHETFRNAAIRELTEETKISDKWDEIPKGKLDSYIKHSRLFDDPYRSERGKVVTTAYLFKLPNETSLYKVKGTDDAEHAQWYKLSDLKPEDFFEDHFSVLLTMLNLDGVSIYL